MPERKKEEAIPNDLLRRAREERGWSQKMVADMIDADTQNIIRWETGVTKPRLYFQQKLSQLFEKSFKELGFLALRPTSQSYDPSAPVYDSAIPVNFRDSGDFVGRDQLLREIKQLLCADQHVTLTALNGLPGVGKTAIAIELAHDTNIQEYFTGGILWAGLGKQPTIDGILSRWGKRLGMTDSQMEKLNTSDSWAEAIHAAIGERRMFIVLDDAWAVEHVLACQLGGPSCVYLITTRLPDVATHFAGEQTLLVEELDENDAFLLLERLAPLSVLTDRDSTKKLVHAVGGLPLAITLMGRYLRTKARHNQRRRIQDAVDHLQDAKERLLIEEPQGGLKRHTSLPLGIPLSLHTIIGISYEDLSPRAQQCLQAFSMFPAKPNSFSEEAALAVSAASVDIVDQLVDYGLVEVIGGTRYALHQTISDYAVINRLDTQGEKRMVEYFVSLGEKYRADYEVLEQEMSNMQCALHIASTNEMKQTFIKGVNAFCHFLNARGFYIQAESYLKQAQTIAVSLNDESDLVDILVHLGKVASNQGNYEQASAYLQDGLDLAQQLRDAKRLTALLQSLGAVAIHLGRYEQAEDYLQKGLDLAQQLEDFERQALLLQNLGALAGNRGNYGKAEDYLQKGVELVRQFGRPEHLTSILLNLGALAGMQRNYKQAEDYLQEGLELARQLRHYEYIIGLLVNLGQVVSDMGNYKQAEDYLQEGLELARQLKHRERQAFLLQNLGEEAGKLGNYKKAEDYFQQGLELARQLKHREHITALLGGLGEAASEQGNYEKAEDYFQQGLELARQLRFRFWIATILSNRGKLHLKRSELRAALNDFHEALEEAPQEMQDVRADALFGLAQIEAAQGNYKEARRQGEKSLKTFEKISHKKAHEVGKWLSTLPFSS